MAEGGFQGKGTLLKILSGVTSVETSFDGLSGEEPDGGLTDGGGVFFGVTRKGGNSARGTFFGHTPGVGTVTLASFNTAGGSSPEGPLTPAPDGFLYGVAREGGSASKGAIVRISPAGARTTLISFTGTSGSRPDTSACAARARRGWMPLRCDRKGWCQRQRTIFKVTLAGAHTTLTEFNGAGRIRH
jgi:uncharacterized repeat protein (TIGR03803 family)